MVDLKSKILQGLFWSFIDAVGLQGVRFIIGIILARLLFPEQFGLIGMLMIFMAIAQTFLDSGFGAALIQKKEVTQTDICSIFYFNIFIGIIIAGIMYIFAPLIASFYRQPVLIPLTRAMSLILIINSFGLIQGTILSKRIDFKTQTKVSLSSSILSGIIGIVLAVKGFGVWSLAVQQISGAFLRTLFLWIFNNWRPTLTFSLKSLGEMFSFGSKLLASGILNQIFENIYFLIIGKLFSATDLGYFTRAKTFGELPNQTLSGIVARITFPVFSSIQDDPARLKRMLKRTLTTLVLINFPMMIGLIVIARPLILVLLTEKWMGSIVYLQLISIIGLLYPLHVINLNVLQGLGRSDLFLRLEIIKKILVVLNIAITWRWGISAMILGMIGTSLISYYLNSYYVGKLLSYKMWNQIADILPIFTISVTMGLIEYFISYLLVYDIRIVLLIQIITGILFYIGLSYLFKLPSFMEILDIFKSKYPGKIKYILNA